MRCFLFLLVLSGALSSCAASGPVGFWSEHRYDRQLHPQGPWRGYYPGPPRRLASRERFQHGRAVGRARFYNSAGTLEREEIHARAPEELMRITYFHPNGRPWRTGQARMVAEPDGTHFYWFGEWSVYSEKGQPVKVEYYEAGKLVAVKPLQ
jgi:hypothetical protein